MLPFPDIDPVLIAFGPLKVRWYGLMYVLGFTASYFLVLREIGRRNLTALAQHFENLNVALILCLILGGRLGYVLFYNLPYFLNHPTEILATWQGGMSFHGALIGLAAGGFFFCRMKKLDFLASADVYIATVPVGLALGRIGNFINGELFGRVTDVPWAMIFPGGGPLPRHPSQLYQAVLEGPLLFWLLARLRHHPRLPKGGVLALFLCLYGLFRVLVEFVREPDPQLGAVLGFLTMGQLLSLAMIGAGCAMLLFGKRDQPASR